MKETVAFLAIVGVILFMSRPPAAPAYQPSAESHVTADLAKLPKGPVRYEQPLALPSFALPVQRVELPVDWSHYYHAERL